MLQKLTFDHACPHWQSTEYDKTASGRLSTTQTGALPHAGLRAVNMIIMPCSDFMFLNSSFSACRIISRSLATPLGCGGPGSPGARRLCAWTSMPVKPAASSSAVSVAGECR